MNWQKYLRGKLKINVPLSRQTTLRVGGPAEFWTEPKNLTDLQAVVDFSRKKNIPLRVIGAGSNLLVNDAGIRGVVVKLNSPYFKKLRVNQRVISAGAGVRLAGVVRLALEQGLSGFELLAGIPGTVGGALIMNAGNIGDRLLDVTVMDKQSRVRFLRRGDVRFGYRKSNLSSNIILSAHFKLIKGNKRKIRKRINDYLDYRKKTQDLTWPSAGCFFKNPNSKSVLRLRFLRFAQDSRRTLRRSRSAGLMVNGAEPSAAYFIERCGMKGSCIGDAVVSSKHANFIINKGKATYGDILRLTSQIKRSVKKRFNLVLEPEIKIWK